MFPICFVGRAFRFGPFLLLLAGLGCLPNLKPASEPVKAPVLRIGLYDAPLGLDPHHHDEFVTYSVSLNLYEGLVRFDSDLRLEAALAESWENPNDLTWRFYLRPGVRFHDGRELTIHDVRFSLERALAEGSRVGSYLVAVDRIEPVDERTLDIVTSRPYPILLNKLARVLIVPEDSPEEIVEPIGTGPYRLVKVDSAGELELEVFDQHWEQLDLEQRVRLIPMRDPIERAEALILGELDVATELSAEGANLVEGEGCCNLAGRESVGLAFLNLPTAEPPFDDLRVRRAIQLSIDRDAVIEEVFSGRAEVAGQLVSPTVFGFSPSLGSIPLNREEARQLLSDAGFPEGFEMQLVYRSTRPDARAIQSQLESIGLTVELVPTPWDELYPRLLNCDVSGVYLGGYVASSGDASDVFDGMLHTRDPERGYGSTNFSCFSDPEIDALIEESGKRLDMTARREILGEIMERVIDVAPVVPIYVERTTFGLRDGIHWAPRVDSRALAVDFRRDD